MVSSADGTPLPYEPPPPSAARLNAELGICQTCDTSFSNGERFCPFDGAPLEPVTFWDRSDDPLIGCDIDDRYVVESVISQGGMGTVYRVRHKKLESFFAMKVLHRDLADDHDVATLLIEEARATAAIGHPNIVGVADFGEVDRSSMPALGEQTLPYFVMELLSGPSLSEVLEKDGKLGGERTANIMVQLAGALAAAHKAGIIHRDLKPQNIRITADEIGGEMAKVLDFGVAKVMGSSKKTQTGMVFGTPHYMSPEQGQGKTIDHRSDIYSLGVLMYECLTGSVPFVADTFMGVITKHMFEAPEPLAEPPAEIDIEPIMMRCLEKNVDARYQSMADVVSDLERAFGGGATTRSGNSGVGIQLRDNMVVSGGRFDQPAAEPRRWLWAGLTIVVAAAVCLAVVQYAGGPDAAETSSTEPASERHEAESPAEPAHSASGQDAKQTSPNALPQPGKAAAGQPPNPGQPPGSGQPETAPPPPKATPIRRPQPRPRPKGDVVDPWAK